MNYGNFIKGKWPSLTIGKYLYFNLLCPMSLGIKTTVSRRIPHEVKYFCFLSGMFRQKSLWFMPQAFFIFAQTKQKTKAR